MSLVQHHQLFPINILLNGIRKYYFNLRRVGVDQTLLYWYGTYVLSSFSEGQSPNSTITFMGTGITSSPTGSRWGSPKARDRFWWSSWLLQVFRGFEEWCSAWRIIRSQTQSVKNKNKTKLKIRNLFIFNNYVELHSPDHFHFIGLWILKFLH